MGVNTGRINQMDGNAMDGDHFFNGVPGRTGDIRHQGSFFPKQTIEQA